MNKMNENLPPPKKIKLIIKAQEKEGEIKINLQIANLNLNDWKFQIHWNKVECVNSRSIIERKNIFLCLIKQSV